MSKKSIPTGICR